MLLFAVTGDRAPELMLQAFTQCDFDYILFCPIITAVETAGMFLVPGYESILAGVRGY